MVSETEVTVRLFQEVQKVAKKHSVASVMLSHTSHIILAYIVGRRYPKVYLHGRYPILRACGILE